MKKLVLTVLVTACAVSVFAQGTVIFNNRLTGTLITYVYEGGTTQVRGAGPSDVPAGTFDWTGYTRIAGAGYSAQLLAAPGADAPLSALIPALPVTTFRTGGAAGNVVATTATLSNVLPGAPVATLMMVAWDNKGGLYQNWDQAKVAWEAGLTRAGTSAPFNVLAIGGGDPPNPAPALTGLTSFNIYLIPEPSTFALAGLGAAALMIFRRRK